MKLAVSILNDTVPLPGFIGFTISNKQFNRANIEPNVYYLKLKLV